MTRQQITRRDPDACEARVCSDCPKPISKSSASGRCKPCASRARFADPDARARQGAVLRKTLADPEIAAKRSALAQSARARPEVKARHAAACAKAKREAVADPVKLAKMQEAGRVYGSRNLAALHTPEVRARAAAAIRRHHLAWCPEPYWPLNTRLKRAGYGLPDRQRLIADEIATVERRRIAAMSPHERQMERVRNGATLIEVHPMPRAELTYTPGGVASYGGA